ncbi:putative tyrosyl-tRNA synthetase [Babesia bovis T2Bo]|uniref:putative tyrosyl-tRNA synthetase n=1 Tax=Babesia bovis T2Bo TaxID=484906 RepID=UPI001DCFE623|nr:putative tyrosyl-tRNA synthetase [Babesia bovis T2Bo]EDO07448.2 putative tyrosyl-tRNA synthetase [Babesia bovis T2Bo]
MWHFATPHRRCINIVLFRLYILADVLICLLGGIPHCSTFKLRQTNWNPYKHNANLLYDNKQKNLPTLSNDLFPLHEKAFSVNNKEVRSAFLCELIERGLFHSVTDLEGLDEFLCEHELSAESGLVPAVYYGIDLTADFIHEGTLLQILLLRRFLTKGFNVVVVLGGGTTLIGDPSFKARRTKATLNATQNDRKLHNVILNRTADTVSVNDRNYNTIYRIVKKLLTQKIENKHGDLVEPIFTLACDLNGENIDTVISNPYNVVLVNNRDLYDKLSLTEYLTTVARHMSVGRMLSRDSIKSRLQIADEGSNNSVRQANMDLAEFIYMSLQATDFIHVSSMFNAVIQVGGSDQMGNIMSGIELGRSLGALSKTLYGITTPLLQTRTGEKLSKSNNEDLLRINTDTPALSLWSHFRNVDDKAVRCYLKWLTKVPLDTIEKTMNNHVNDAKILLANELTTAIFGEEYTKAIHKHWISGDITDLLAPKRSYISDEFDSLITFIDCVPQLNLNVNQLMQGIPFGDIMDNLRKQMLVSGRLYNNRRAIREGTCRINGVVVKQPEYRVTEKDLLTVSCEDGRSLNYIAIQYGKRQLYFILVI